jgi:hypothetical protein
VNGLVERLLMFLESGYDHIVAETLIQLRDLLRRYPDLGEVRNQKIACSARCRVLEFSEWLVYMATSDCACPHHNITLDLGTLYPSTPTHPHTVQYN